MQPFLIDENLPPDLVELFKVHDQKAYHINSLKKRKNQRIIDDQLRKLSIQKQWIIVTKDDDFVKSFVDRNVPEKLVYVFGLNTKTEILFQFKHQLEKLLEKIPAIDFIEINKNGLRFPFSD